MKKLLVVLMIGLAATSYGNLDLGWAGSAGFYFTANPAVGILGDATGNSTIAQLMYSPDDGKDAINPFGVGVDNDVVWDSVTITENGISGDEDEWAYFGVRELRGAFTPGYVYALIFQDSNVEEGDYYYYTSMMALRDQPNYDPPQWLEMNTDLTNGNAIDSGTADVTVTGQTIQIGQIQAIPEPASIMMIGLGGLLIAGYRRFYGRG